MTILFIILLISLVFGIIKLAFKAAWGITKIIFTVILLPLALILLAVFGFIAFAIPIIIVIGLVLIVKALVR